MTEPYKKVGRGGAGNFYTKKDIEAATTPSVSTDLEAQLPSSSISTPISSTLPTSSNPPPEYLHTGRGGAGNWIAPQDLTSSGLSQSQTSSTPTAAPRPNKTIFRGGRGGAGNYVDTVEEERLKKEEDERRKREVEERISRDVEAGLARPERAYGGLGGVYEMK